jgi:hypothetical protein
MSYILTPGQSYVVRVHATNSSKQGGVAVPATLGVNMGASAVGFTVPYVIKNQAFGAGETRPIDFSLQVPYEVQPGNGTITANVLDPNGNVLATASVAIRVPEEGELPDPGGIIEIEFPELILRKINDQPFVTYGEEFGLASPIVVDRLAGLNIEWQNKTYFFSAIDVTNIMFFVRYIPRFVPPANYGGNSPSFRGYSNIQLTCQVPDSSYECTQQWYKAYGPFVTTCTANILFGGGYWFPGVYDVQLQWGKIYFDQYIAAAEKTILLRNVIRCTTTGGIEPG